MNLVRRIFDDEAGATAIEYGLIACLISLVAVTAFSTMGSKLNTSIGNIGNHLP